MAPGYVFANDAAEAPVRLAALSALFDRGTVRHLKARGVGRGWHCLEVGAGGGTIARWLAARVGPTGRVLATDVDPRFLRTVRLPNLEVRRHDIAIDPLPRAAFDLIHTRLVLMHLPRREEALARMISALKPGGWLVVEELDSASALRIRPRTLVRCSWRRSARCTACWRSVAWTVATAAGSSDGCAPTG